MLHRPNADKSSSAAQTCFAVNSNRARSWLGKVSIAAGKELIHDMLGRCGAICEDHVFLIDSVLCEACSIILGVIESNDLCHVQVLKDCDIALGRVAVLASFAFDGINGTHEGHKLAWNDPVKIAVLDFFVVLILSYTELFEIVPTLLDSKLKSFQTMQHRQFVKTVAFARVSVVLQLFLISLEFFKCKVRILLQNYHHESSHQKCSIRQLCRVLARAVVVNPGSILKLVAVQQLLQFPAKSVNHCKIKWAEIPVERHVGQVLNKLESVLTLSMLKKKAFGMF